MSDFEDKLNAILSNPEAMGQIMNLAQSLNPGGSGADGPQKDAQEADTAKDKSTPPEGGVDLSGLSGLLGQIDPKMIQRLLPLAGELTGSNDERLQLLYALRPFLKPERRDKVDQAAKTARLIHIGKKLLKSMGEQNV